MDKELQEYIAKRMRSFGGKIPSQEIFDKWLSEYIAQVNDAPLEEAEGYSLNEMNLILNSLWLDNCPVQLKNLSENDLKRIPVLCQTKHLIDILLKDEKIKLTATGAIPPKIVKEMYALGAPEYTIEEGISKLSKEIDSITVQLTHILLTLSKIAKVQKNVMTLTVAGKKIAQDDQKILFEILKTFTIHFNKGYFDGYKNNDVAHIGVGFGLVLVSKYGSETRSEYFYSKKYLEAFSQFGLDQDMRESDVLSCFALRFFQRFLYFFGFIEMERQQRSMNYFVKKTPLFDKAILIKKPKYQK
ncbi:MAG: hypothetical protein ACRCX4_03320 [Bacteroidales bacterium]